MRLPIPFFYSAFAVIQRNSSHFVDINPQALNLDSAKMNRSRKAI